MFRLCHASEAGMRTVVVEAVALPFDMLGNYQWEGEIGFQLAARS
ncbi:MAG: hypothetical protein ABJE99_08715 [Roseobacter sp.]